MFRYIALFSFFYCIYQPIMSQARTDKYLAEILARAGNDSVNKILRNPETYRLQIIYTQINRDRHNKPSFHNYYFNYDPNLYFNPASMVKLPLAFLALEKLNTLNKKQIDKYTPVVFDSSYAGQKPLYQEPSSESGLPSIAHFIKRAFLISENDPYNRMYQFIGQQTINQSLHAKGYKDARITRQFMGFTAEANRHTNAVRFFNPDGSTRYYQPPAYNPVAFDFSRKILLGKAHYDRNENLVAAPYDFTEHNNLPLDDMQQLLQSVLFPASVPKQQRFNLSQDDYTFLYRYLSQFPSETPYPKYDTLLFYDSYAKFFFRDQTHQMPPQVRVFNKTGWAYGFLTDVSYVADFGHKVEYMLAATLYVNSDGVLNDGKYDYDTIGHPFLYQLGQIIYNYELARERKYKSNLSAFQVPYERRDPNDTRPALRNVDN